MYIDQKFEDLKSDLTSYINDKFLQASRFTMRDLDDFKVEMERELSLWIEQKAESKLLGDIQEIEDRFRLEARALEGYKNDIKNFIDWFDNRPPKTLWD